MSVETRDFVAIRDWVADRCGIVYSDKKQDLLVQRLSRVQKSFGLSSLRELIVRIEARRDPALELAVIDAASTNHTFFFREQEVLDHFHAAILPQIADLPAIRIWSAACSTGDEIFSLAIAMAESMGIDFLKKVAFLGTDISSQVIDKAELGIYSPKQLDRVSGAMLDRYFRPVGIGQFQIIPQIRDRCTFRRMNLMDTPYPFRNPFQVVFCRNILYYFGHEDQVKVIDGIEAVTEPGGWLITSVTERVRDLSTSWQQVSAGISRKAGG